jgi:hypothetical protein
MVGADVEDPRLGELVAELSGRSEMASITGCDLFPPGSKYAGEPVPTSPL